MTKPELYAVLSETLAAVWRQDDALMSQNPEAWQQVRTIDDWLVQYRDDPRVGYEQYQRICQKLLDIYRFQVERTPDLTLAKTRRTP